MTALFNDAATLILLTMIVPVIGAVLIGLTGRFPNLREAVSLLTGVALITLVLNLLQHVLDGRVAEVTLIEVLPGIPLAFEVERLGMMFAIVASVLWTVNTVYGIGYMRGNNEDNQTRFFACFAIAIASTMGIAFAGNLFTLFVFYEILTLSTYPLVTHKGTPEAQAGGRRYMGLLMGTSIGFLLVAIIWTWALTGTLDFELGGILAGSVDEGIVPILLALYMFGIGKAALMPFHFWLPAAMVAPTPVSAFLHAVAVVKAGVFSVLKVVIYVFGIDFLSTTGANTWLIWVSAATILLASVVAMTKDNLKARLAYSTVGQLAYVVLGAAMASSLGIIGGSMQIAMHAMGKITLFMCAGAIYVAAHKTLVSELDGLGRKMPFTFAAFFIGTLSIIGLPPTGGSWSKWFLMQGSVEAGEMMLIFVLMLSSVLNVAYLIPIAIRGFFAGSEFAGVQAAPVGAAVSPNARGGSWWQNIEEAPILCVIPLCLTAFGCFVLFFYVDPIATYLGDMLAPPEVLSSPALPPAE